VNQPPESPHLRRARIAVVAAFVANGILYGSWASRIPAIKEQAGLDAVHLGSRSSAPRWG